MPLIQAMTELAGVYTYTCTGIHQENSANRLYLCDILEWPSKVMQLIIINYYAIISHF